MNDTNTAEFYKYLMAMCVVISAYTLGEYIGNADTIFAFPNDASLAREQDFIAFYKAAILANEGRLADLFSYEAFKAELGPENNTLLWLYPPTVLTFFAPLGWGSYGTAKFIFVTFNIIAATAVGWRCGKALPARHAWMGLWVASPAMFLLIDIAQISGMTTFLLVFGLLWARSRPILSGILLGLLTVKPQYGLLIPVFLLAGAHWRVIATASLTAFALILISIAQYGFLPWQLFFESLTSHHLQHTKLLSPDMYNFYQLLVKSGISADIASMLNMIGIGGLTLLVFKARTSLPYEVAVGVCLVSAALASPSFWFYDWLIISAALLIVTPFILNAQHTAYQQILWGSIFAVSWVSPFINMVLQWRITSILPMVMMLAILIISIGGLNNNAVWPALKSRSSP